MLLRELFEGGWDSTVTQKTVITPNVVKSALRVADQFAKDFNTFLKQKNIPGIKIGHPTGSSAYHDVDPKDKIYGDVDLQIIVPDLEETQNMTMAQSQSFWYKLEDEFVQTVKPKYVHPDSEAGHPIFNIGNDQYVQVDLMPHPEKLATWGRFRTTPERGVKGMLNGNMFSVLGDLLNLSIQHSGVQYKVRDNVRMPYTTTRSNYELKTLTTNIETFVYDIFKHEIEVQRITDPKLDPLLTAHPGSNINEVKISNLVNAVKGLAKSFEINDMFGKGHLTSFSDSGDFLNKFLERYIYKAEKDVNAPKRDKAETPAAKARAEDDKNKIIQGLEYVKSLFQN